jgi:hypothetical protein
MPDIKSGQRVTVIDGGWSGIAERIDRETQTAYIRFDGRPELLPYGLEALVPGTRKYRNHPTEREHTMTDYERWTAITRLATLAVLTGILIMLAYWLPILGQAARIYITMYG